MTRAMAAMPRPRQRLPAKIWRAGEALRRVLEGIGGGKGVAVGDQGGDDCL